MSLFGLADGPWRRGGVFVIGKRFRFEAAHHLPNLGEGHACARVHGHSYQVEVQLTASGLDTCGMVADFGLLGPVREYIGRALDHRDLNDVLPVPTAESVAEHLYRWCSAHLEARLAGMVTAVRVWETATCWAEYRGAE
jgi:6-pyruvoyltetrahydropterin/6-carboxytetrahydropterin synthase